MSYSPPTPPSDLPEDVVETLDGYSPELLRDVAAYAEALADHREREARLEEADGEERRDAVDRSQPPDGVPEKASLTTKEINGNRYYYWQWRDGDTIRSEYEGPVDGDG